MNFYDDIPAEVFQDTKTKLKEYLKGNNKIVVRDHCHWTRTFRGAAHQQCNLMYRKTYKIPRFSITSQAMIHIIFSRKYQI